ncbi:hypothetical protein EJ110_NYTH17857 [Nymphaea thermarum]|nr:hypothetical protein EJ110_NYTH17857 [Nymphaea thermarum]
MPLKALFLVQIYFGENHCLEKELNANKSISEMDSSSESSSLESVDIVDEDNINKGDSHEIQRSSTSLYQGLGEGEANADINLVQQSSKNLQNCHANELDVRITLDEENNEEDEIDLPSSSVFQGLAPYVGLQFKSVDMARSFYDAYAKREEFV